MLPQWEEVLHDSLVDEMSPSVTLADLCPQSVEHALQFVLLESSGLMVPESSEKRAPVFSKSKSQKRKPEEDIC